MKVQAASVEDKGFLALLGLKSYLVSQHLGKVKYISEFVSQSQETRSAIHVQKYNLSGSAAAI